MRAGMRAQVLFTQRLRGSEVMYSGRSQISSLGPKHTRQLLRQRLYNPQRASLRMREGERTPGSTHTATTLPSAPEERIRAH
eukprot:CAMPEP_0175708442 /NCGR_PEP_ID=MMETSP0097-20121207/39070_1 /TAXON_ID=311494 /ORGANISM="Alexandrium monilatum, Strain CCMP3105" /LENGTH=81 /DNA_ID=CAMNT_0017015833 /DNA_START=1 /DNA_END=243 /DNA_ORIENTATION=-